MRRLPILLVVAALAGCTGKGSAAEERYRIVERSNPAPAAKCRAAREVADAYLQDQNEDRYQFWRVIADGECSLAG